MTVGRRIGGRKDGSSILKCPDIIAILVTRSNAPTRPTDCVRRINAGIVRHTFSARPGRQCLLKWSCGFLHRSAQLLSHRPGNQSSESVTNNDASDSTGRLLQSGFSPPAEASTISSGDGSLCKPFNKFAGARHRLCRAPTKAVNVQTSSPTDQGQRLCERSSRFATLPRGPTRTEPGVDETGLLPGDVPSTQQGVCASPAGL